ncbi:MAG: hypothetical protein WAU45_06500 [Blastocatellia bacterium]
MIRPTTDVEPQRNHRSGGLAPAESSVTFHKELGGGKLSFPT